MAMYCFIFVFLVLSIPNVISFKLESCTLVDLSHTYVTNATGWPGVKRFEFSNDFAGVTDAGFYFEIGSFATADHSGTHMDSTSHFSADGKSTEKVKRIKLDQLIGEACLVDISEKCSKNSSYLLSVEDLIENQKKYGAFSESCILLMRTDWSQFWGTPKYYGEDGLDFPGIDPKAAAWLVANTEIRAVGVDTPSTDRGISSTFETHVILSGNSIIGFENLKNLFAIPARGATIVAMPLKIEGASGALTRAFAYGLHMNDPCRRTSGCNPLLGQLYVIILVYFFVSFLF